MRDDRGTAYDGPPPRRVVSLVPSLTEAIAAADGTLLAGATDWCTHPAGLDVPRVGGTKWPDVARVLDLRPDLVVANAGVGRSRWGGKLTWSDCSPTIRVNVDGALATLLAVLPRMVERRRGRVEM